MVFFFFFCETVVYNYNVVAKRQINFDAVFHADIR